MKLELYKTLFRLDFKPLSANVGSLTSIAKLIAGAYPDLMATGEHGGVIALGNPARHCTLTLGYNKIIYNEDHGNEEQFVQQVGFALEGLESLEAFGEVIRIGCRRKYVSAFRGSMNNLVNSIHEKLYRQRDVPRFEPFHLTDVAYFMDYEDENRELHLRVAPCERHELDALLDLDERNFIGDQSILKRLMSELPQVSMFYDIDMFQVGEGMNISDARNALRWGNEIFSHATALNNYIFSKD